MQYRELGTTGTRVSAIGYGAWGIGTGAGWVGGSEDESVRALHRALDLGLTLVDTAHEYGESERIVGDVLADRRDRDRVVVATKVSPLNRTWPAPPGLHPDDVFTAAHLRASAEESLRRLRVEHLDLLQLHVWDDAWLGRGDWQDGVAALKDEGLVGAFGVSLNDYDGWSAVEAVRTGAVDSVQLIYNVFDPRARDDLFGLCVEHGTGVVVRVPLDEGGLTGRITASSTFDPDDFRSTYFGGGRAAEVESRVRDLADDLGVEVADIPTLALRFCLSHPAVSAVIPGMRSVRNVERNCAVPDLGPLDDKTLAVLDRHRWVRNFYQPT